MINGQQRTRNPVTLIEPGAHRYGYDRERAVIMFAAHGRRIRFDLPLPTRDEYRHTPTGLVRHHSTPIDNAWEQGIKQRWRALALVIKAKLEAVEAGIVTFEEEFLAHVVLPDGSTFGQWAAPQLAEVYETGQMPVLLPGAAGALPERT